jgi:hypothetical protein
MFPFVPADVTDAENETEVSFFNRVDFELFKLNPEVRFSFFIPIRVQRPNCIPFRRNGTEWHVEQTAQQLSDHL